MVALSESIQAQSSKETLQQTIDRVLLDGKVSKEELTELASKYETGKKDATDATKASCAALLKESVTGMLKEYTLTDLADQKKLESLIKTADLSFTVGVIDFKHGPVKVKLDGAVIRPLGPLEGALTLKNEHSLDMKSLLTFRQFSKIEAADFINQALRIFRNKEELQGYLNALDGKIDQTSKGNLLQYIDDMLSEGMGNVRHLETLKGKIQGLRLISTEIPPVSNVVPSASTTAPVAMETYPVIPPVTSQTPAPATAIEKVKDTAGDTSDKAPLLAAISKEIITSCNTGKEYNKHPETVKAMQKLLMTEGYAVAETGVYDKDTRAAVRALQTKLQEKWFYVSKIDGAFGGATYAAYEDFIKGNTPRKIEVAAKDCPPGEIEKGEKKTTKGDRPSAAVKSPESKAQKVDKIEVTKVESPAEKFPTSTEIRSRIKPEANVRLGIVKDFGNGTYELDISYITSTLGHEYSMITKVVTKITAQELKSGKTWKDMDFRPLMVGTDNKFIPGFGHAYDVVLGKNGSLKLVEPGSSTPIAKPKPTVIEKKSPVQPTKQVPVPSTAPAPIPAVVPPAVRKAPAITVAPKVAPAPAAPTLSPAQKEAADKAAAIEKKKMEAIDTYLVSQGFTKNTDGSYLNHEENLSLTIENGKVEQDKLGWRNFGVLNDQEELVIFNVQNLLEGKAMKAAPSTKPTAIKPVPTAAPAPAAKPVLQEYDASKAPPKVPAAQPASSPLGIPGKMNDALSGKTTTEKPSKNPLD